MSEDFDIKKYQKDENIKMNIILKNYVLIPATKIEGTIEITPKKDIKLKKNEHKILFKITQFEMVSYYADKIGGDKEEKSKNEDKIIIQKEIYHYFQQNLLKVGEKITIDFSFFLPGDEKSNFYPTFEFRKKRDIISIRHLLTIEMPSLETANSVGLIIGKLPKRQFEFEENNFSIVKTEEIKNYGKLEYKIMIPKASFPLNEKIPIQLYIDSSNLKKIKIDSIEINLERFIKIKLTINTKFWGEKADEKKKTIDSIKYEDEKIKEKMNICEALKIKKQEFNEQFITIFKNFDEEFLESQRMELTPSINSKLFECQYTISIIIIYLIPSKLLKDKTKEIEEKFEIDLYTLKPEIIDDFLSHYFNEKKNRFYNSPTENEKPK